MDCFSLNEPVGMSSIPSALTKVQSILLKRQELNRLKIAARTAVVTEVKQRLLRRSKGAARPLRDGSRDSLRSPK